MEKRFHTFFVVVLIYFNSFMYGMESIRQEVPFLPDDPIAHIAGYCRPREKNLLMKVCKAFNACLKKRELILLANPWTVGWRDKEKGMFTCADSGDTKNLSIWLHWLKQSDGYVNATNILGLTAFHIASENNHKNAMRVLVEYGAEVNTFKPAIQPLHKAIFDGNKKLVEALLVLKVNANLSLENGMTPLGIAIDIGSTEIVALLCRYGVNVHNADFIFPPLYYASQCGHAEIVEFLINEKIDVDQVSSDGWTSLHIASQKGYLKIVALLVDAGADVNRADRDNSTSLEIALQNGYFDIVKLLIDKGANIHHVDNFGYVPLDWALQFGYDEITQLLLFAGAYVHMNPTDRSDPMPLPKCRKKGLRRLQSFYKKMHKK